jgi:hypothetical protein
MTLWGREGGRKRKRDREERLRDRKREELRYFNGGKREGEKDY